MTGMPRNATALICIWAVLSCLCTRANSQASTDEKQLKAVNSQLECLIGKAKLVDDHFSDAAAIAAAIQDSCLDEDAKAEQALGNGLSEDAQAALHERLVQSRQELAIRAVLEERSSNPN